MSGAWTAESVQSLSRQFQAASVLVAAADLDLFSVLKAGPADAHAVAMTCGCDVRAMTILLDALTALQMLEKDANRYAVPASLEALLTSGNPESVLAMIQHQGTCLRRWAQLPHVVKRGRPAERVPGARGPEGDQASFIEAMHVVSGPVAEQVVADLQPMPFECLLDLGGASGTWTIPFLRAVPTGKAIVFDLPPVVPMAEKRMTDAGLAERVNLAAGDFETDALPHGADLVWISAIIHQNSREQNRRLFRRVHDAMLDAGRVLVRDIVMDEDRVSPPSGALFAVNMLVGTEQGGTFTLAEIREDLQTAGFSDVELIRRDPWMNSVVSARKR